MTERGRGRVACDAHGLQIGPSAMRWIGDSLRIDVDEITAPWPTRLRGVVTLHPAQRLVQSVALAPQHRWFPIAPTARVEVELGGRRWSGPGYLDSNRGDAPLEQAFRRWDWSRAALPSGGSAVFYDVEREGAEPLQIGLRFAADGSVREIERPPVGRLPRSAWGLERQARSDPAAPARVLQTLTDAPFYARSLIQARWLGEPVTAMHESLSLTRFERPWVQAMLPFRMPRRAGG